MYKNGKYLAVIHEYSLPYVLKASDKALARFIRAQICQTLDKPAPKLSVDAKLLLDAHNLVQARADGLSRQNSENGKKGGAPKGNRNAQKKREQAPLERGGE